MGDFIFTPEEMKKIDQWAIEDLGIPAFSLMEQAARGIVDIVESECSGEKVIVFSGSGNNGGDGFAAARYLHTRGYDVLVVFTGQKGKLKGEAKKNFELYTRLDGRVVRLQDFDHGLLDRADIIIDAIFGTGFRGKVEGKLKELIEKINSSKACVVSVDIPSGINGLTGEIGGAAVKADITGTMAFVKRGLLLYPGRFYAGKIIVIDIGIPPYSLPLEPEYVILDEDEFELPVKMGNEHKGKNGKLLIISGSRPFTGAPVLSANAAQKIGAGLVYLLVKEDAYSVVAPKLTEPIVMSYTTQEEIKEYIEKLKPHGILFGPGVGRNEHTIEILEVLLDEYFNIPLIIDADGIWALAKLDVDIMREDVVITPHPGEAAFLLNKSPEEIDKNRLDYSRLLRMKTGVNVVLKGNPTVVSTPLFNYVNILGNEGLGKGGSGDVLAGFIGGLLVQNHDMNYSILAGVYIHALLGDILYDKMNGPYYTPHELIDNLHLAFEVLND